MVRKGAAGIIGLCIARGKLQKHLGDILKKVKSCDLDWIIAVSHGSMPQRGHWTVRTDSRTGQMEGPLKIWGTTLILDFNCMESPLLLLPLAFWPLYFALAGG